MLETSTVRARVELGAAFLDANVPGWERRVDVGRLRVFDPCDCPLGQLFGLYATGLSKLGLGISEVESLGFNWSSLHLNGYAMLDVAWREAVAARLPPPPPVNWTHREPALSGSEQIA